MMGDEVSSRKIREKTHVIICTVSDHSLRIICTKCANFSANVVAYIRFTNYMAVYAN
jgi:hypothetical protein